MALERWGAGMRRIRRCARWLVLLACAGGCSAGYRGPKSATGDDPVHMEVERLRREQIDLVWQYDRLLMGSGDACNDLCTHHTKICVLATRVCDLHKQHPGSNRIRLACEATTRTCRDTNERLPRECWCRS